MENLESYQSIRSRWLSSMNTRTRLEVSAVEPVLPDYDLVHDTRFIGLIQGMTYLEIEYCKALVVTGHKCGASMRLVYPLMQRGSRERRSAGFNKKDSVKALYSYLLELWSSGAKREPMTHETYHSEMENLYWAAVDPKEKLAILRDIGKARPELVMGKKSSEDSVDDVFSDEEWEEMLKGSDDD